jgi:hypothetical protein
MKNSKDLYRGINDFKKGYQPTTNIVKYKKAILASWRNYFSQLLSVHGIIDVRQTEIHTEERLVPEPSASEGEMAIES